MKSVEARRTERGGLALRRNPRKGLESWLSQRVPWNLLGICNHDDIITSYCVRVERLRVFDNDQKKGAFRI